MRLSIDIPEELYEQARGTAEAHNISVEQISAPRLLTNWRLGGGLRKRADCGDREKFQAVLDKVQDIEPREHNRL